MIVAKYCIVCKREKSIIAFDLCKCSKINREYYRNICKDCKNEQRNKWRKYQLKDEKLRDRYGIDLIRFELMLKLQNNKCFICGEDFNGKRKPNIDHCHRTQKVRGLLCHKCNSAIGYLNDDPELLKKAAMYLEKSYETSRSQAKGGQV